MEPQTYYPEAEQEPEGRNWLLWGGLIAAAVAFVACACLFCLGLSTLIYLDSSGYFEPQPTDVPSQPPKPVIAYPKEAIAGQEVPFDGSASEPGSSPIASYDWNFGDGNTANGAVTSHVYAAPGAYQVTLTVTDQEGLATTGGPVEISILDGQAPQPTPTPTTPAEPPPEGSVPPQPVINYPLQATVGQEVTFDGSQSQPGSSPISSYDWNLGDGTIINGAVVTHFYGAPGIYQITLSVTGQDGLISTGGPVQIEIKGEGEEIEPTPPESVPPEPPPEEGLNPVAVMRLPAEAQTGDEVIFDGGESRPGTSGSPIASYEWDFGDGSTAEGARVTHIYNLPGSYMVILTVFAEDDRAGVDGPREIIILEEGGEGGPPAGGDAPVPVMVFPASAAAGTELTFDGSQSRPGSSPIKSYNWNFGDGSVGRGMVVPYTYTEEGVYRVQLTVVDEDGRTVMSEPGNITVEEE